MMTYLNKMICPKNTFLWISLILITWS